MTGRGEPPIVEELERRPSDYLYAVRDAAGKAAEELSAAIAQADRDAGAIAEVLGAVIDAAKKTQATLSALAQRMEQAAELVAASDLEPTSSAVVPGEAGLVRAVETPPLTLEQLHALPDGSWVRTDGGEAWYRRGRFWSRRGPIQSNTPSDMLYANAGPIHLIEKRDDDA